MLWSKFRYGVLRVGSGKEARLIRPSALDRLRLLWMFRNFPSLPLQVLSARQRELVERLSAMPGPAASPKTLQGVRVIGSIERPELPPKKPSTAERLPEKAALRRASGMNQALAPPAARVEANRATSKQNEHLASTNRLEHAQSSKILSFPPAEETSEATSEAGNVVAISATPDAEAAEHAMVPTSLRAVWASTWKTRARSTVPILATRQRLLAVLLLSSVAVLLLVNGSQLHMTPSHGGAAATPPFPAVQQSTTIGQDPSEVVSTPELQVESNLPGPTIASQKAPIAVPAPIPQLPDVAKSPTPQPAVPTAKPEIVQPPSTTTETPALRLSHGPPSGIVYPNYPMTAWRKGTRGTVRLRAKVDAAGVVSQIETMEGDPILALAAERALRRWRYGTQPALAEVVVRFRFVNPEAIFVEFER